MKSRNFSCAPGLVPFVFVAFVSWFISSSGSASAQNVPPPQAKRIDWKGMDALQRKNYMKKTVLPAMQKVFADYDPVKYQKVTCYLCHGEGVTKEYKMPNGLLPKLPVEPAGWKVLQDKKPEATQFMSTKVKPRMAALLGEDEWTSAHPGGFGCYDCHAKVGAGSTGR